MTNLGHQANTVYIIYLRQISEGIKTYNWKNKTQDSKTRITGKLRQEVIDSTATLKKTCKNQCVVSVQTIFTCDYAHACSCVSVPLLHYQHVTEDKEKLQLGLHFVLV